jgi:hypothetical protein
MFRSAGGASIVVNANGIEIANGAGATVPTVGPSLINNGRTFQAPTRPGPAEPAAPPIRISLPENRIAPKVITNQPTFSMEWYYATGGQRNGPISETELGAAGGQGRHHRLLARLAPGDGPVAGVRHRFRRRFRGRRAGGRHRGLRFQRQGLPQEPDDPVRGALDQRRAPRRILPAPSRGRFDPRAGSAMAAFGSASAPNS